MNRIADSEIAPAMAALTRERNLIATAAKSLRRNMVSRRAIEDDKTANPADQFLLPANVADSAQIPFPLLADIGDQQEAVPDLRRIDGGFERPGDGQQRRQTRAVVGNTGSAQIAVPVDRDVVFGTRRKNGIQMRRQGDERALRHGTERRQYVACTVDGYMPAHSTELGRHPFGALLLEEGRGGNAAKLQVNLIDPLLFPGKPLEGLADTSPVG